MFRRVCTKLTGLPPTDAVAWVRANYCGHAIETAEQETFIVGRITA